jgi:hypothetical protein
MVVYRVSRPAVNLDVHCKNIVTCLASECCDESLLFESLNYCCSDIYFVDRPDIDRITRIFVKIYAVCQVKKSIIASDGKTQTSVMYSLAMLLNDTLRDNYHSVRSKCKYCKKGVCSMGNPLDGNAHHVFSSGFHWESLTVHSVLAAIHTCVFAIDNGYNDKKIFHSTILALFHDIGKMQTVNIIDAKKPEGVVSKLWIGFPAHGEVGMIMWLMLWCPDMEQFISRNDYFKIGLAMGTHMCGYHNPTGSGSDYKLASLELFNPPDVNELLSILMIGDYEGKIQDTYEPFNPQTRLNFIAGVSTSITVPEFFTKYKFPNTVIIYLIGRSGVGKSHFADKIMSLFPAAFCSRDIAIATICVGIRKRLEGFEYKMMYNIYEAGKRIGRKDSKSSDKQAFIDAQVAWNTFIAQNHLSYTPITVFKITDDIPNISEFVKDEFNQMIVTALSSNVPFVIIDTFMSCFPQAIESCLTSVLSKYFRIHIQLTCTDMYTSTTLGGTIDEQLTVSGPFSIHQVFHPDARNIKPFSSISTENNLTDIITTSVFRPNLVLACNRTGSDLIGDVHVFDTLTKFMYSVESTTDSVSGEDQAHLFEGVDPKTKDMNFVEFFKYTLEQNCGNINNAIEYINKIGFKCSPCLRPKEGEDHDSFCSRLAGMANEWFDAGVITTVPTVESLKTDSKLFDSYANCILMFSYLEIPGAKYWKNKWAKEMRGCCLFINPESSKHTILNFKLPRGAEVATGIVKKEGISTQDCGFGKTDILDDEQIDTCNLLSKDGNSIDAFLTSKADGSLLSITVYTGNALKIMVSVINYFGSDYVKLWMFMSLEISGGSRLVVPATHRTLMESGFMANYMVTSILVGGGIVSRDALIGLDYMTAWSTFGHSFITKFLSMGIYDHLSEVNTFIFEAICKLRTSAFDGIVHIELACSYEFDDLVFLGVSIVEKRFYIPHMLYGREFAIPFNEPLWWKIDNSSQISAMMQSMEDLIFKKITKQQYLELYKPANTTFVIDTAVIDFEGWVFMKVANIESTDPDHLAVKRPITIYSKIKTLAYYNSHKFKERNVPYLMELGKVAGDIFPMSYAVTHLLPDGVISSMLIKICDDVMTKFDFSENSELMMILDEINKTLMSQGKKDSLSNFAMRPIKSKFCSVFSFNNPILNKWLFDIFMSHVPVIAVIDRPTLIKIFKKLFIDLAPWDSGFKDKISTIKSNDPILSDLVAVYFS